MMKKAPLGPPPALLLLAALLGGGATQPACWPTTKSVECERLQCPYCPGEYVEDSNGCPTCQCKPVACLAGDGGSCGYAASTCSRDADCSEGRTCQPDPTDPCNGEAGIACLVAGSRICLPAPQGCGGPPAYRDAYRGREHEVLVGVLSGRCTVARACGSVSFVDCHSDVDGPAFYVQSATGCVLEVCGGACMLGRDIGGRCVACPPPEWTCSP